MSDIRKERFSTAIKIYKYNPETDEYREPEYTRKDFIKAFDSNDAKGIAIRIAKDDMRVGHLFRQEEAELLYHTDGTWQAEVYTTNKDKVTATLISQDNFLYSWTVGRQYLGLDNNIDMEYTVKHTEPFVINRHAKTDPTARAKSKTMRMFKNYMEKEFSITYIGQGSWWATDKAGDIFRNFHFYQKYGDWVYTLLIKKPCHSILMRYTT